MAERMIMVVGALAASLSSIACGSHARSDSSTAEIQGGQPDPADAQVGLLFLGNQGTCSGTLIAPNVVLTAAHCAVESITSFSIGMGAPLYQPGIPAGMVTFPVVDVRVHPTYLGVAPNGAQIGTDLALARLAVPIPWLAPAAIARTAPQPPGTSCDAIGFGWHDEGGVRTIEQKRSGTVTIAQVDGTTITVVPRTGITAQGDSGGPLACGGNIAGTVSVGSQLANESAARFVIYVRVDAFAPWIDATVSAWSGP